jgi:hypothetical protein
MTELSSADRTSGSMTIVALVLFVSLAGLALITKDISAAQKTTSETQTTIDSKTKYAR